MQLVSLEFFLFFALLLLVYGIAPQGARWIVLLLASLVFYLYAGLFPFIYIILISLSSYIFALFLQKYQKEGSVSRLSVCLYIAVLSTLALWVTVKLSSSAVDIILPIGISFYSLRIISYLIDIKRKRIRTERNFLKYLLFVTYFPLILQGPVVGYGEIAEPLYSGRRATGEEALSGSILALWGIFKKVVVANTLSAPLSQIVAESERYSGAYVLFLICFYSAEIYADFSGGIDMVRGASQMLGIPLPKNFDRPFASTSLCEFWNRWHISLGEWFEHYVFYPLSLSRPMQRLSKRARARLGSKRGRKIPLYIATMTTWLLTGLWHGARSNYIAWGLINGALILVSGELSPLWRRLHARYPSLKEGRLLLTATGRARVFLIIGSVRLLDLYGSVRLTFKMLGSIFFDPRSYADLLGGLPSLISPPALCVVICALLLIFAVSELDIKAEWVAKRPLLAAVTVFSLALISLIFGAYGAGFDAGEFIYSQF